jgi:hypothetical protein
MKVAYNFQGLQIGEPADTVRFQLDIPRSSTSVYKESMDEEDPQREEAVARKRVKLVNDGRDHRTEVPETPDVSRRKEPEKKFSVVKVHPLVAQKTEGMDLKNLVDPIIFKGSPVTKVKGSGSLGRSYPSINRLADSKSRSKRRASTPPLSSSIDITERGIEPRIVDPERAALTWHDNEITGHDPDDPDDDGEGINGIGFKPTAAEAYARTQKRRQQMAEYKTREAREARKIRSERRRGAEKEQIGKEAESARRVRFIEEANAVTAPLQSGTTAPLIN